MTILQKRTFLTNILFVAALFLLIFLIWRYLFGWILPFILGFLIAYLLRKPTLSLSRVTKLPQKGVAVVLLILFYLTVGSVLWFLAARLFYFLGDFLKSLPDLYTTQIEPMLKDIIASCQSLIGGLSDREMTGFFGTALDGVSHFVQSFSQEAITALTHFAKGLPGLFMTSVFTVLSSFFISFDYSMVVSFLTRQIPKKYRMWLFDIKDFLNTVLFKLLKAYTILSFITFIELTVGFFVLGISNKVLAALVIALLDMVPVLGCGAVILPWTLLLFLQGNIAQAIGMTILYAIIIIVRSLIEPKIVSSQIGLHPLITLTSMFLGLRMFGVMGMFLLPIAVLILKYMHETGKIGLYKEKGTEKKQKKAA